MHEAQPLRLARAVDRRPVFDVDRVIASANRAQEIEDMVRRRHGSLTLPGHDGVVLAVLNCLRHRPRPRQ